MLKIEKCPTPAKEFYFVLSTPLFHVDTKFIVLFVGKTKTKYIKLKPKIILLFLDFFIKNDVIILAFLETIWQKYQCLPVIFLVF